jgi:hypothetical protein
MQGEEFKPRRGIAKMSEIGGRVVDEEWIIMNYMKIKCQG